MNIKEKKYVDLPGVNIEVTTIGRDRNGNKIIALKPYGSNRAFSIQTNQPGLNKVHTYIRNLKELEPNIDAQIEIVQFLKDNTFMIPKSHEVIFEKVKEEGKEMKEMKKNNKNKKNESSVEFTGTKDKSIKDIKNLLKDTNIKVEVESNGKVTLNTKKDSYQIFKDDIIEIKGNKIIIKKPIYVGTPDKEIIVEKKDIKPFLEYGNNANQYIDDMYEDMYPGMDDEPDMLSDIDYEEQYDVKPTYPPTEDTTFYDTPIESPTNEIETMNMETGEVINVTPNTEPEYAEIDYAEYEEEELGDYLMSKSVDETMTSGVFSGKLPQNPIVPKRRYEGKKVKKEEANDSLQDIIKTLQQDKTYFFKSFNDHRIGQVQNYLNNNNINYATGSQVGSDYYIAIQGSRFYEGKSDKAKCPDCGNDYLKKTGYCLSCKKKVKKEIKEGRKRVTKEMMFAYLGSALWSSTNDEDEPLDSIHHINDFSANNIELARKDIQKFLDKAGAMTDEWDDEQIGHDLWLTRNRHGAGFWDRDLPFAQELSDIARDMGEKHVFSDGSNVFFESKKDKAKCPTCGNDYLKQTGYCVSCKKKVKTKKDESKEDLKEVEKSLKSYFSKAVDALIVLYRKAEAENGKGISYISRTVREVLGRDADIILKPYKSINIESTNNLKNEKSAPKMKTNKDFKNSKEDAISALNKLVTSLGSDIANRSKGDSIKKIIKKVQDLNV